MVPKHLHRNRFLADSLAMKTGLHQNTIIFTDGACSGNPGPGGWGAIVIQGPNQQRTATELGGDDSSTTNNRMELTACLRALLIADPLIPTTIYTDSQYVIQGMTAWIFNWLRRGGNKADGTAVTNWDLWLPLYERAKLFRPNITWKYVPGHAGVVGNERCDQISVDFSKGNIPQLYHGALADYPLNLEVHTHQLTHIKLPNPVYLVFDNNKLFKFSTWAQCEAFTKGKKGLKFKKVSTANEVQSVLKSWGVSLEEWDRPS